ncbi:hypothetical protein Pan181_14600 [Aeoliella mucimassa]|uniref:Uncharacterized protein n=1 Tax=Aeoliella mucimassa TaxID=2527972 RepID=A0A518AKM5_9BACT|nr:hypothetical protein Pan181_14600 [Aeoliella mucimassa]
MQLITYQGLATAWHRENRFPLDALLGMGIYLRAKTTGFIECVPIQFSHRWENWESISTMVADESYPRTAQGI